MFASNDQPVQGVKKTTEELVQERPSPEELFDLPRTPISILVDNVRSLDNVGLIFRLAELARVSELYLAGYTGHPRKPNDEREEGLIARHENRIFKTAVYALPLQPWTYVADPEPLIEQQKKDGSQIVVLEQTNSSRPYHEVDYTLPLTLVVGHERQGVRQGLVNQADLLIEIPILGHGNSHNVATAAGIVLYHILAKTGQI